MFSVRSSERDQSLPRVEARKMGVRIDSGDIAYLTKTRKILDEAGLQDCSIVISTHWTNI